MDFDQPPVVRVYADPARLGALSPGEWPWTVPAVEQLINDGLPLAKGVTFLVGENGSGKSTITEAVAMAYGLSPEGGSSQGHHTTWASESPLGGALRVQRGLGTGRWGFFLRAETMHGWYSHVERQVTDAARDAPLARSLPQPRFHEMSHGESFLEVLRRRFGSPGFYVLDEPEAALSFNSTLTLIATLADVVADGGQVLCATHSPILASMPGARILEVGGWGLREAVWEELDLTYHWKAYLTEPQRYLRHILD